MKHCGLLFIALLLTISPFARGADDVKLEPNARWHLYFPDLPDTLAVMVKGEKHPAQLTVRLPANYSPTGKFPLFVFLNGGDGGFGDRITLDQKTIGSNDFICVGLPLFKRRYIPNTNSKGDAMTVVMEDYETISRAYRIMLQKLFHTVPNITTTRSAIGGFSNGAHTLGLLLDRQDEFILQHFRSFDFVEGGFGSLAASVGIPVIAPALEQSRILVLYGDKFDLEYAKLPVVHDSLIRGCVANATMHHFDFTSVVMHGYGHELPPEYGHLLASWVRGEKLPELKK